MKQKVSAQARKPGRPSKPKGETLDAIIPATRCKKSEREEINAAAERKKVALSDWIRQTLLKAARK
jgi:predicted HicB family RNase H-like nuclease